MKDLSGSIMIVTTLGSLERVLLCVIYHCLKLLLSTMKKGIYFWYATHALCDIYVELAWHMLLLNCRLLFSHSAFFNASLIEMCYFLMTLLPLCLLNNLIHTEHKKALLTHTTNCFL